MLITFVLHVQELRLTIMDVLHKKANGKITTIEQHKRYESIACNEKRDCRLAA